MDFPTFENGAIAHTPFANGAEFLNELVDMPHGYRYAYNLRPLPIHKWQSTYSLSDAELITWNAFYDAAKGNLIEFRYTDPHSGVLYPRCRLDMDANTVIDAGPNEHQVTVTVLELP